MNHSHENIDSVIFDAGRESQNGSGRDFELYTRFSVGTLRDRYENYVSWARSLGWPIKSFDEWLNS